MLNLTTRHWVLVLLVLRFLVSSAHHQPAIAGQDLPGLCDQKGRAISAPRAGSRCTGVPRETELLDGFVTNGENTAVNKPAEPGAASAGGACRLSATRSSR